MDLFLSIFLVFVLNTGIECSQIVNDQLNSSQTAAYAREYIQCRTSEFCSNGGTCYMEVNKKFPLYYCKCPDKYYGETCQFNQTIEAKDCEPEVADHFCMNGGTCYADIFQNETVTYCLCSKKFWGSRCESIAPGKIDHCPPFVSQALCLNEGTCYETIMDGVKREFCACTPEYIGLNCGFKVVEDNSSTILNELLCLNKGVCNRVMWEDVEIFGCSCQQGFYGDRCEYRFSVASSLCSDQNFCKNGGTCYEEVFGSKKMFFCTCMKGYTGQRCEITLSIESQVCQDWEDKFCANGGTCFQVHYKTITHRFCECTYQFGGPRCETKLPIESICPPPLDTQTCENNGTCLSIDTGREQGAYMCKCVDGYYGSTCEYRLPLQLMHRACPPELLESFCSSRGTCYKDIIMNRPFYYCECSKPYRGVRCEINIEEKLVSCPEKEEKGLCHHGGVCSQVVTHYPSLYICQCKAKTFGARCEYCIGGETSDHSCPPPLDKVLCKNGGTCVMVAVADHTYSYFCSCPEGLYGISCEYPYSILAVKDDCPSDVEKTFCLNGGTCYKEEMTGYTVYMCECVYPYTGERCELMSIEKFDCSPEINSTEICLNNGLCTSRISNGLKVYVCECTEGHFGARCEHKVDIYDEECPDSICMNGGTCITFIETRGMLRLHYCKCVGGFFGVLCEYPHHSSHEDRSHLSCPGNVADKYCEHGGTCYASILNGKPVYYCDCREGYHGITCEFQYPSTKCPEEIAQHLCLHGTCFRLHSNGVDSYQCVCDQDFYGDRCEYGKSVNETICSPPFSSELCKNNGTCVRTSTKTVASALYYCICPRGFYGTVCQHPYHPGLEKHEPCWLDVQSYCLNGGTCYRRYINNQLVSVCECVAPYYGDRCEYSLRFKNSCQFPFHKKLCVGGTCTQQISHGQIVYSCVCSDGYYGARCEHRQENISHYEPCPHPLENSLCANGGSCVASKFQENHNLYFCKCREGYYGLSCEHIIPQHKDCPNEINWCLNGGTCFAEFRMNRVVYKCKCTSPFYGERCEKHYFIQLSCPSNMQNDLCYNGGTCIPINVGRDTVYYCKCVSHYYGSRCEYCEEQVKEGVCPSHLNTDLCKNGGTCITIEGATKRDLYYCKCPEGLYGLSCEYPYPHLATVGRPCPACLEETYCSNGGTCYREDIMGNSVYHCECVYPYHGERCDEKHPKQPNCPNQFKYFLCLNSGTCVQSKSNGHNIYICICQDGYYGPRCEHTCEKHDDEEVCEDPFSRELCKNGGTCVPVTFPEQNKLLFCKCQAGVFGTSCEYPFLPLLHESTLCPPDVSKYFCMNGGTCYKDMDSDDIFYYCSCPDTYFGERCELNIGGQVHCPFNLGDKLCLNGGLCVLYQTHSHHIYLCYCADGYYGPRCEYSIYTTETDTACPCPIDKVLCMNGATCAKFAVEKGQHIYFCKCADGYYGMICEHKTPPETAAGEYCPPEVAENWCQNGGTCYLRRDGTEDDKDYYCHCVEPFQGARCEIRHPEQLPCPQVLDKFLCVNGGVCTTRFFPKRIGVYYYCDCPMGYSGARCENTTLIERKVKFCGPNTFCKHAGKCLEEVIDSTVHCHCFQEYYGERCQFISQGSQLCPSEYEGHICFNGGTCWLGNTTKLEIAYCKCQAGYYGQQCEFTEPKPTLLPSCPSEINNFLCLNGGTCVAETIHKRQLYYCECPEQNFGLRCEYNSPEAAGCDVPGFCQNCGKCYSFKFSGYTVYSCVCDPGYHGSICQYTMQEPVTQKLCSPEISDWFCFSGGTCFQGTVNNNADYYCICPVGTAGHRCQYNETDLQSCDERLFLHFCKNQGICKTVADSYLQFYLCVCPSGYGGRRCDYVNHRIDVCPVSLEDSFCLNNGSCRVLIFLGHIIYYCECQSAFYGIRCEETVPLEYQNETCPENIAKHFCLNNGTCLQKVQQKLVLYVCKCEGDFWGERCEYTYLKEPYCPIEFDNFYCLNGGTCYQLTVGKETFYHCECLKNFFGSRCESQSPLVGPESERCIGEIDTYFCLNNGICYQSVVNNEVFYSCVCPVEWVGLRCEEGPVTKENCPSELEEKYCFHNGTCIKLQIGILELYYCKCPRGFEGTRCEYSLPYDTNPCSALLSGLYCLNGGTCSKTVVVDEEFYLCDCPEGFWGRQCEFSTLIRNFCPPQLDTSFCLNGGTCYQILLDDKDLYYCVCTNIYYGKRCENSYLESHESEPCQPKMSTEICLNGGSCYETNVYGPKLLYCECAEGYSGKRCEHQNTGYLHISHLNLQHNLQRSSSSMQMDICFFLLLLWFSLCYKTIF